MLGILATKEGLCTTMSDVLVEASFQIFVTDFVDLPGCSNIGNGHLVGTDSNNGAW